MEKHIGRVKFFGARKGWGFIKDRATGKEYFVHHRDVISENGFKILNEGEGVVFEVDDLYPKGPKAINVEVIKDGTEDFKKYLAEQSQEG